MGSEMCIRDRERGVNGFRLDTINFYFHDQQLRDNPALPPERRNASIAPSVNPYNHQEHLYSKNRPENLAFLRKLRAVMNPYRAAAVGEVGDAQRGLELMGEYTSGDDLMQMCYAFEFLSTDSPNAERFAEVMARFDNVAADGWACWAFSNHDVTRHKSRWNLSDDALRVLTTLIMCLRGSVCIYQGEELGLDEADVAFDDLQDPYGIEFWPEFKGRDGCRTPMVWTTQDEHAGFSHGKPWLPVSPDHAARAVDRQESDPKSLVHHYRNAIKLRRDWAVLRNGDQSGMTTSGNLLSFTRSDGNDVLFCVFNLGREAADTKLPDGEWRAVGPDPAQIQNNQVTLEAWQCLIAQQMRDGTND